MMLCAATRSIAEHRTRVVSNRFTSLPMCRPVCREALTRPTTEHEGRAL